MSGARHELRGTITSVGFLSGDRFVVGRWLAGPVGPMVDVMWARPGGERVLLAPDADVATFVTAVYGFDRVEVVPFVVRGGWRRVTVAAGPVELTLTAGRGLPIPAPGVPALWRWVAGPVAQAALGVATYGVSPSGVREWYRARRWAPLRAATASVDGVDLGPMGPVDPPVRFGFSEPPRRPSMVDVRPLLHDPSGGLDRVLATLPSGVTAAP